jgi:hypothetical protein
LLLEIHRVCQKYHQKAGWVLRRFVVLKNQIGRV